MPKTYCSASFEKFVLPHSDCVSHVILELKGIPNSHSLILGHNDTGSFALWYVVLEHELNMYLVFAIFFSISTSMIYLMKQGHLLPLWPNLLVPAPNTGT